MKIPEKCLSCKYFHAHFILYNKFLLSEINCGHCTKNFSRMPKANCIDYKYDKKVDLDNQRMLFLTRMLQDIRQYMTEFNKKFDFIYHDLYKD